MNERFDVFHGFVRLGGGRILEVGRKEDAVAAERTFPADERIVDLRGRVLLPGFVQSHLHCCQTIFRGAADDLPLLRWLRERIWPLEAAHDAESIRVSTELTAFELIRGGTTSFLSMETTRHTEVVLDALAALPIRAVVGHCLMDEGDGVPRSLLQRKAQALDQVLALAARFPHAPEARLEACVAPRFALSCSPGLLADAGAEARRLDLLVHTHGAEQRDEVAEVRARTGQGNIAYLERVALLDERLRLAHAVHLDDAEEGRLAGSGAQVLHCPSSNLKLGSGIAPVARYLERGIPVALGADGAPCNNSLDALREARLAALLQKALFGPAALPAHEALALVTRAGARALRRDHEIGSIEPGKRADLVEIDLERPHLESAGDWHARVLYAAGREDVRRVWFGGEVAFEAGAPPAHPLFEEEALLARAREQARRLHARAGLAR